MKVLIATWGVPAEWRDVTYSFKGKNEKGCSTLSILSSSYDKIFVLALESVFDFETSGNNSKGKCRECFVSNLVSYGLGSYRDFISNGEKAIKKGIECMGIDGKKIEVLVLPSVGHPGPNRYFEGDVKNFASIALIRLYDEFLKLTVEGEVEEICLDTTHGLNFMPTISLDITRFLAQLIYMKQDSNQKDGQKTRSLIFKALNADPLPRGEGEKVLRINEVLNESIGSFSMSLEEDSLVYARNVDGIKRKDEGLKLGYSDIKRVLKTVYYPFPLLLADYTRDTKGIEKTREITLNNWYNDTEMQADGIVHRAVIGSKFVKDLLAAETILDVVRECIGNHRRATVDDLEAINSRIFRLTSEINYHLILNETSQIRRRYKDLKLQKKELLDTGRVQNEMGSHKEAPRKPDRRIMIAHGGFQLGFVYVYPGNSENPAYSLDYEEYRQILEELGV